MKVGTLSLATLQRLPGSTLSATAALRLCDALTAHGVDPATASDDAVTRAVADHEAAIARDQAKVRQLRRAAQELRDEARAIEATLPERVRLER